MATYLELVRDFVSEVGVGGGEGPESITIKSDGIGRVVQFIRESHDYICRLWPNWDFLWVEHTGQITQQMIDDGATLLPLPDPVPREYDKTSFQYRRATGNWLDAKFMDWHRFHRTHRRQVDAKATDHPGNWTRRPDRRIEISNKPSEAFHYRYQYWHWAAPLAEDGDEIIVPLPRIVLVRAKIIFAERENAPEIMHGAASEYSDLMDRLESTYLPGIEGGQSHDSYEVDLQ